MKTKIILKKDYSPVGEEGDIKEVSPGYARNYLIPQNIASLYNSHALHQLKKRQHIISKKKEERIQEARSHKEKIESDPLTLQFTAGEKGRLFGAVTSATISEELAKKGINIERKFIDIPNHSIKEIGAHEVKIRLYNSEIATLKLIIQNIHSETNKTQVDK